MTIKAKLRTFSPAGLSDAEDAMNVFQGACASLINLIPKPSTRNLWVPRPAQTEMTNFDEFSDPGFISAMKVIGTRVYGMIASSLNSGKDEPFIYEIEAGTFVTITGVTNSNTPASPSTTGNWTPPIMELVGTRLIVTHPGFTGSGGVFFGWFDLSNLAAPVWNGGNTSTTPLPFVPTSVANFNGRAYFAVKHELYITDPLTLAVQPYNILSVGDNVDITGFKGLGFQTLQGGVVQSLLVFRGLSSPFQIKGDPGSSPTDSTLTADATNYGVGTQSPLSLIDTPIGAGVICPDGLRFIGLDGQFSEPVGAAGDGVNVPFLNALVPSRIAAASNGSTIRVSVQNGGVAGTPHQEYWLHLNRNPKIWSGPHTFVPSLVQPYKTKFITTPIDAPGTLYMSETVPSTISVYEEMGAQLEWQMSCVMFSDYGAQGVYNFNEMTVNMALDPTMGEWHVGIVNPDLVQYDLVNNIVPNTTPVWDAAVWDEDVWDGVSQGLTPRRVNFSKDITTSRAQFIITGGSAAGVIIGETKYNQGDYPYVPETGI